MESFNAFVCNASLRFLISRFVQHIVTERRVLFVFVVHGFDSLRYSTVCTLCTAFKTIEKIDDSLYTLFKILYSLWINERDLRKSAGTELEVENVVRQSINNRVGHIEQYLDASFHVHSSLQADTEADGAGTSLYAGNLKWSIVYTCILNRKYKCSFSQTKQQSSARQNATEV